jgi:hypothetical protein
MTFEIRTTMIGSMPHLDADSALDLLDRYPLTLPAWPQLPKRSFCEGMTVQYTEGFPGVAIDETNARIELGSGGSFLDDLAHFYEHVLEGEIDHLGISDRFAAGFHAFINRNSSRSVKFPVVKGQITGPFTAGLSLTDADCKSVWFDEQYRDVIVKGVAAKGVWQARMLRQVADKIVIFFDEPIFAALGSPAYMGIEDDQVTSSLDEIAGQIHAENATMGVHCCGNMDWSLLASTAIDIISFDAYSFGDKVALYPEAIAAFLERGGTLAWGIVPTDANETIQKEDLTSIKKRIADLEDLFVSKGLPLKRLQEQRLITPSCGLGNLTPAEAERALMLLKGLAG